MNMPEPETIICPNCAAPCREGVDFCSKCQAPLTSHATTDPMGTVFARGFAARKVMEARSPLVVIGAWMWFLPLACVSLFMIGAGLFAIAQTVWRFQFKFSEVALGLLLTALGGFFLYISGSILFRSSRSYLRGRETGNNCPSGTRAEKSEQFTASAPTDADGEMDRCLACGQVMSPQAIVCPTCGWSFHD